MEIRELLVELLNEPWALLPSAVQKIMAAINGEESALLSRSAPESRITSGQVAIIPIQGPIGRKANPWIPSAQGIAREVRQAAEDESVKGIVLDIDSPGGTASGIQETADLISGLSEKKPIVAVANNLAASAAYWIASAAREIVVVPSAEVGSIGVFAMHADESGMLDQLGIKVTMVTSSKYKAEFSPWAPLSEEARSEMQRRVNETHADFVRSVASGRGIKVSDVEKGFGEGRTVRARDAVKRGMADRIGSLESTIERLQGRYRGGGSKAEEFTARDIEEILKASDVPANMAKRLVASGWSPSDSREETEGAEADSRDETAEAKSRVLCFLQSAESTMRGNTKWISN